jgi:hypothetical protein
LNGKLVALKGPLDFFVPQDFERLRHVENCFLPPLVEKLTPIKTAARVIRGLLTINTQDSNTFPPAPFELSDAILRTIGPLWNEALTIEPFVLALFVDGLCGPFPGDLLVRQRERDAKLFETALFRSSLAVFLALHLGSSDLNFLVALRQRVFSYSLEETPVGELETLAVASLPALGRFEAAGFAERPERLARKIFARLQRVRRELLQPNSGKMQFVTPEGVLSV